MKRYLLPFLSALLFTLPVCAQKEVFKYVGDKQYAKLFSSAVSSGRSSNSFYHVKHDKDKPLTEDGLKKFCKDNNLHLGKYAMRTIYRFGDEDITLDYAEFIPESEYPVYLMNCIVEGKNVPFENMKTAKARYYIDINGEVAHEASVLWSGAVVDGWANGKGTAVFFQNEFGGHMIMDGEFQKGMPVGDMTYRIYNGSLYYESTKVTTYELFVSPVVSDGMRCYKQPRTGNKSFGIITFVQNHGDWGFLDANGNVALNGRYDGVVTQFKDGKAIVSDKGREFYIDKSGNYIDDSEAQKKRDYDADLNYVKNTAQLQLPKSYLRENGIWNSVVTGKDYYMDRSDYDRCNKALSLIQKYDTPDFNQYWDGIYDIYQRVIALFNSEVDESNALNHSASASRERERARQESEKEAKIAATGVKSVKWPSEKGKTNMFSSIEDGDYDLNGGEIELTNGKSFSWYIVYHDNKIYAYRYWVGLASKSSEFDTYEEMVDDMRRQ